MSVLRARKRFGQHFLHDQSVLAGVAGALALNPGDPVLEIGPGHGALTEHLWQDQARYVAVEIDRDLAPLLRARYPGMSVVNEDILRSALPALLDGAYNWRVVGNLPYNISTPLLLKLADFVHDHPERIQDCHFMLQKELAERLAAQPGSKTWGRLGVVTQLTFRIETLFDVAPESFTPPPRVWSTVVRLVPAVLHLDAQVRQSLDQVLRAAFSGRRKRLANALKTLDIDWSQTAVNPDVRADDVSRDEFVELAGLTGAGRAPA